MKGPVQILCVGIINVNVGNMGGLEILQNLIHFLETGCVVILCQYDPRNDPAFNVIEDPILKVTAMRYQMHGDHIVPRALGGTDAKENIQVLCKKCHDIKSFKNGDFSNKTKKVINDL